ncbi:hypothetical protein D6833_08675 [Candidatus Parcubacteria bacterium]|nr:MAG: hypothetical protein D6833_08675 [Candidatus Parcubacteria bacterium]
MVYLLTFTVKYWPTTVRLAVTDGSQPEEIRRRLPAYMLEVELEPTNEPVPADLGPGLWLNDGKEWTNVVF